MKLILASSSPRRVELLRQVGFDPEIKKPEVDEALRRGEAPKAMVARLALEKAQAIVSALAADPRELTLVIAADTTVVAPNGKTILGKPETEKDAARMLNLLSGHLHIVHTGYCILGIQPGKPSRRKVRVVTSKVKMRKLSPKMIAAYIRTGEPMDKAGSYGAQGIGMGLIERLNGSYTNVVGLPMAQLLMDLETTFGVSSFDHGPA